jgi:head-tail adaptor
VDAGSLRDVIDLQRPTYTREAGYNAKVASWVSVVRGGVRGRAQDISSDNATERTVEAKRTNARKREIIIRWVPGVATTWRLRVNAETHPNKDGDEVAKYWQIIEMADLPGYREGIRLVCEEYAS